MGVINISNNETFKRHGKIKVILCIKYIETKYIEMNLIKSYATTFIMYNEIMAYDYNLKI